MSVDVWEGSRIYRGNYLGRIGGAMNRPTCALCGEEAVTAVIGVSLCDKHYKEYQEEGRQYLSYRPFYNRLVSLADEPVRGG